MVGLGVYFVGLQLSQSVFFLEGGGIVDMEISGIDLAPSNPVYILVLLREMRQTLPENTWGFTSYVCAKAWQSGTFQS